MTEMVGGIFKEDIRYRPHLLSVVGAGTDQPFYVAMHLSKWDVFSYMHGGSHTYCRAAGSGAGQCVSSKTSPALKVLGNERARFPPKCKRRLGLQLLESVSRTFQTSKNNHNMIQIVSSPTLVNIYYFNSPNGCSTSGAPAPLDLVLVHI